MLKKIIILSFLFCKLYPGQDSAKFNDFEPIHILAALQFPIDQISSQDTFTQEIFANIDTTFGPKGINLDNYQLQHLKKTYLYLIFLTKLEKIKNDENLKQYQTDFAPFLIDNGQVLPYVPTAKLLNSNGWLAVKINGQDIVNSTMWQLFCKSMITDINAYLIIGLKLIHNCEKQEFNYIPHFETSYYNQDYVQIRNINAVVRIKIALEQEVQKRYLEICNDWKKFSNFTSKSIAKLETQIVLFQKTDFYQKTHNMHNFMGTQSKFNANKKISHQDLLSAPGIQSPLKEYVFGFFLLYELYGQITSFMQEENLDSVLTIASNSNLVPNIFPYIPDDYILISELLAGKNIIQDKPTHSIHPTIKTFKPEDLRDIKDWINPTRRPTNQYLNEQLDAQKSVQAQTFLSFFSDVGQDLQQGFSEIEDGVEKACSAVKDFAEGAAFGLVGFTLTTFGDTSEGNKLLQKSTIELRKSTDALESAVDDFGSAIKDGIAPVGELARDIVSFVTDDQKIGADIDTVITNCADALVNIAVSALNTTAVSLIYVYTLPEQIITALIETMVAAVVATFNQQAALDICHSILRSLVTTFMMVAQVTKDDFHVIMSSLGTFMNSITTLFNDLIREMTVIITTGGIGLITNIANAAGANISTFDYANKAADTIYNQLNQHRAIINQVVGVAVMIGADILTGGAATTADIAIDAELEGSLTETTEEAEEAVANAREEADKAETAYKNEKNPQQKEIAKRKLDTAEKNLKEVTNEQTRIKEQVNQTRSQAQDIARQSKEEQDATTFVKKLKLKIKNFYLKIKNFYKKFISLNKDLTFGSFKRTGRFFKSFKGIPSGDFTLLSKSLAEPTQATIKSLEASKNAAGNFISGIKNIPDRINSLLEDGKNLLPKNILTKTEKSADILSSKINDLKAAQQEFDTALQNYSATTKDSQDFATQQENLINSIKKLRQTELDFENASQDFSKNLQKIGDQQKDLVQDPLKVLQDNAQADVQAAQSNLERVEVLGNQEDIAQAKNGLQEANQELNAVQKIIAKSPPPGTDALSTDSSLPVRQQISNKLDDALEYIKSKGKSFKNLFKSNSRVADEAETEFQTQETELRKLNSTLKDQKATLQKAQDSGDTQTTEKLQKDIKDTESKIVKQEKTVTRAKNLAKEQRGIADETARGKAVRYLKNAFSPIGMFMNIAFNFTSIIGGYNQDQKNLLQQKQQEQNIQDLWKANTETKLSVAHTTLALLNESTQKQKAFIGNKMLQLSLFQNYSYANLEQFEQAVRKTLAMIYSFELYPDAHTGLMVANTGSNWGLVSDYINLYPSEGFYVTTTGRADFPYSQEVAQGPHLLTQKSKTKKQWFNQRCTAIDNTHKNGIIKKADDPLEVAINFKFLYTLDSELYVGIYMGGNYHNYFAKTYLAALLGTTTDKLDQKYAELKSNSQKYMFNLNFIDLNETYMAKMIVLYKKSGRDSLNLGIYEHNLTDKEWILQQIVPVNMQLNQDHTYNLQAKLDQSALQITLSIDNNPPAIKKTVTVTPIKNQRMYGIITSGAAIEWNQTTPDVSPKKATIVRKTENLTLEINRNKENKLILQNAINQTFGGKILTLISANKARIFGQYIYASVQTDIAKIYASVHTKIAKNLPAQPADLLVFATNNNGSITNIGKAPNSFKDDVTNVLVSLITGHVFDQSWNCIATVPNVWQTYNDSSSDYGPFSAGLYNTIEQQQKFVFSYLQHINFGTFPVDAINITALESNIYLYTCTQTITDASGKPFMDYVVFAPNIVANQSTVTLGLPPTAPNATTMVSLITGNVYAKNTKLVPNTVANPITTLNITTIATYLKQNLSDYSQIIFNQTQQYENMAQQKSPQTQNNPVLQPASQNASLATKTNWFIPGKTFHLTFNFSRFNLADRQRQAAGNSKIQTNLVTKVVPS